MKLWFNNNNNILHDYAYKSEIVENIHEDSEEDGEPTEKYVTEVRAYLEEQKHKTSTERNTRQISGGKKDNNYIFNFDQILHSRKFGHNF